MSQEPVHTYDFRNIEVFEAGVGLLTLLAHPEPNHVENRGALHGNLCALVVTLRRRVGRRLTG